MISAKITNLMFVHPKKTRDDENNLIFQGKLLIKEPAAVKLNEPSSLCDVYPLKP